MSRSCKCDICDKLYEASKYIPNLSIYWYRPLYGDKRFNLCDECYKKLEHLVDGDRGENFGL